MKTAAPARLDWPDAAKGLGIVLVYYGHVLAAIPAIVAGQGQGNALEQMRFIYAFHMPLFFLMAGFFYRPAQSLLARFKSLALRRLVPVVFFGLLLMPIWLAGPIRHGQSWWQAIKPSLENYLYGHPDLDFVTWFLVCLFICECLAAVLLPRLRSTAMVVLAALLCLWAGVTFCNQIDGSDRPFGLDQRTWYFGESIVALSFYLFGRAGFPTLSRIRLSKRTALAASALCFALTLLTDRLSTLPEALTVMMSSERHGQPFMFGLTALLGSVAIITLAMALPRRTWLVRLGQLSMPLLGLSGLFYHFINHKLMQIWPPAEPALPLTLYTLVVTGVSLALVYPIAAALMRWYPRLLGMPPATHRATGMNTGLFR